jgi:hypothetical protein
VKLHQFYSFSISHSQDGFDVSGRNVWIHDSSVWNQDDCFCVKDASENVLIENVVASGLGTFIDTILQLFII